MPHVVPSISWPDVVGAVVVAAVFVAIFSFWPEPARQRFNAVFVAGAGSTYFNGGLGVWDLALPMLITTFAFFGLRSYRWIGVAWMTHASWDVAHHFWASPILAFAPTSSAGCAICDPLLALWLFLGAPSIYSIVRSGSIPSAPS